MCLLMQAAETQQGLHALIGLHVIGGVFVCYMSTSEPQMLRLTINIISAYHTT